VTKVLTIEFAAATDTLDDGQTFGVAPETIEIHFLNVGELFPPAPWQPGTLGGFGGGRHPLVAGHDFASGKRHKKPKASIVMRRRSAMGTNDREVEIDDPAFWAWIGRMLAGDADGMTIRDRDDIQIQPWRLDKRKG